MQKRYFLAENATTLIAGKQFECIDQFAGTVRGVFETADEKLIEELKKLKHVTEITDEEYAGWLKKKVPSMQNSTHSNVKLPLEAPVSIKQPAGVVVEGGNNAPKGAAPGTEIPETVDDVLKLERVDAELPIAEQQPQPAPQPQQQPRRQRSKLP